MINIHPDNQVHRNVDTTSNFVLPITTCTIIRDQLIYMHSLIRPNSTGSKHCLAIIECITTLLGNLPLEQVQQPTQSNHIPLKPNPIQYDTEPLVTEDVSKQVCSVAKTCFDGIAPFKRCDTVTVIKTITDAYNTCAVIDGEFSEVCDRLTRSSITVVGGFNNPSQRVVIYRPIKNISQQPDCDRLLQLLLKDEYFATRNNLMVTYRKNDEALWRYNIISVEFTDDELVPSKWPINTGLTRDTDLRELIRPVLPRMRVPLSLKTVGDIWDIPDKDLPKFHNIGYANALRFLGITNYYYHV